MNDLSSGLPAEIAGWTGHVLAGPRSDLDDILRRDEAKRNGSCLLLGDDEEAVGGVRCYIGRTENLVERFRDHRSKKEFWDRVVLITAKDDSFTEGHWGYLARGAIAWSRRSALPRSLHVDLRAPFTYTC